MHVIPKENYTLDATAGTITLSSPYDDLDLEQFITVVDLDTNDVIYDVHLKRDGVTFANGVLTYTADNNITNDDDDIRIVINDTSGTTQAIGGYSTTLDALKIVEQAPVDQQGLDEKVLNAVTAAGASTAVNVLDKSRIIFIVDATNVTTGFDISIEGSPNGDDWGEVGIEDKQGVEAGSININSNGIYLYRVVDAPKYIRANITSYTDGTASAWIQGGAI
jgi:hypothetical protein